MGTREREQYKEDVFGPGPRVESAGQGGGCIFSLLFMAAIIIFALLT